jgi:hypothetical protein
MDVLLTFTNESYADSLRGSRIVLFQKNLLSESIQNNAIAWRVFDMDEPLQQHRFHVSMRLSVAAMDTNGQICEQHLAENGQHWTVVRSKTSDWMILSGDSARSEAIEIRNMLPKDVVSAQIYKDGRLLNVFSGLKPGATANFSFDNKLYIALVDKSVNAGDVLPSPEKLHCITELVLDGFSKASLFLSGAGSMESGSYSFRLIPENFKAAV